jgi:hypothetical protein
LAVDVRPTYAPGPLAFEGHLISPNDTKWNDVTVRNLETIGEAEEGQVGSLGEVECSW